MTNTKAAAKRELAEILDKYDTGALPDENAADNLEIVLGHVRALLAPPVPPKYRPLDAYCYGERVEVLSSLGSGVTEWTPGVVVQLAPNREVCRVEADGVLYRWANKKTIRPAV